MKEHRAVLVALCALEAARISKYAIRMAPMNYFSQARQPEVTSNGIPLRGEELSSSVRFRRGCGTDLGVQ
eukprot:4331050-Alexandrium_andersonii.AAC.1